MEKAREQCDDQKTKEIGQSAALSENKILQVYQKVVKEKKEGETNQECKNYHNNKQFSTKEFRTRSVSIVVDCENNI